MLLSPVELSEEGVAGSVTVTGFTDSQVSASVVTRGLTTSFPPCAVAMELAAQLEARNAELLLEWVPREVNAEADRLAGGRTAGFDPELRVRANLGQVRWLVLDRMLAAGKAFQEESARIKARARAGSTRSRGGGGAPVHKKALREREPW